MNFNNIVGQREVVDSLNNLLRNDRVGHAYIFCGLRGIGKRTVAQALAGMLLCEERGAAGACGKCLSCRMFENGSNPDFITIDPEGDSIGIDNIRDLQSDIYIKPMYSSRKVYLVIDADRMTPQAQNCLLKTLEEPPGYAVFILTVSNYEAMLETIHSRTTRYNFRKNTNSEVMEYIGSRFGNSLKGIDFIVSYADGIIGTAHRLAESDRFISLREKTIEIILRLMKSGTEDVFEIYAFFDENKDEIDAILDIMLLFFRDLLVAGRTGIQNILINSDKKDIIIDNASRYDSTGIIRVIDVIGKARREIKHNANFQLVVEVMLMKVQEELI